MIQGTINYGSQNRCLRINEKTAFQQNITACGHSVGVCRVSSIVTQVMISDTTDTTCSHLEIAVMQPCSQTC